MSNKMFSVKPQVLKTPEQAYSELLGNSPENQIVDIKIDLIDTIDDQPHKIHTDTVQRIAESMRIYGQLEPATVVQKKNGRYALLAGRHRRLACIENGTDTLKCIIRKEDDPDKQRLILLATNNDRNTDYSPSELAYSYLEQMELLKKLGSKSTASQIAEGNNTNRKTVHKYIQLTKLIKPLMSRVDSGAITVGAGYELSFLTSAQQTNVINFLLNHSDCHITKEYARAIREYPEDIANIFYAHSHLNSNTSETEQTILSADKADNNDAEEQNNSEPSDKGNNNTSSAEPKQEYTDISILSSGIKNKLCDIIIHHTNIDKEIVCNFSTPQETNKYFKELGKGHFCCSDPLSDYVYSINPKLIGIQIPIHGQKYILSFGSADTMIREYIRKVYTSEKLIALFENNEEG